MSAWLFDETLNIRLNDVPLPAGLLAKLLAIPLADDADLDSALANVSVPASLIPRLARIADDRQHWWVPLLNAAAAVLVFAASLGYALSAVAFVYRRFEEHGPAEPPLYSLVSVFERGDAWLDESTTALEPPVIELAAPTIDDGELVATLDETPSNRPASGSDTPWRRWRSPLAPARPSRSAGATLLSPTSAGTLFSLGWLTSADGSLYDLAPIDRASLRLENTRALDCNFWRRTGMLPWLDPAQNRGVNVPLVQSDSSYRLARQKIQTGGLPAPAEIRGEEFIAGIDYGLQNESAVQPLILVAAPSPFTPPPYSNEAGAATSRWLLMAIAPAPPEDSQDPAVDRRLNFEFSAEHVAAYRIVGYCPPESGASGDALWPQEESDQSPAARAPVVLCEIELWQGSDREDGLVRVSLGGEAHDAAPPLVLRSDMFSPDFDSAPVVWRQAALVALAAERLAGSPYAEFSLGEIAALARQIEPAVYDRPGWQDLIAMLVHAQTLQGSLLRAF